jgi:DNA invertase Pin-like site-specific DNA recombinase
MGSQHVDVLTNASHLWCKRGASTDTIALMARRTKPSTDPKRAVCYLRVSTDDQQLGPEAQLAAVQRWAGAQGIDVVSVHRDVGVSGGAELADRPALIEALAALETSNAGILVVAKRDRLARDVVIAATVERLVQSKGARIVSADGVGSTEGAEGALMAVMVDAFAAYERALIQRRTTAALAIKRSRGERLGTVPIGFGVRDDGKQLVTNAAEQAVLTRICELRDAGFYANGIADVLNEEGFPARGKRWHGTTVRRLLERLGAVAV